MKTENRDSDKVSWAAAVIAILVLGGLLVVPGMFIFYGAGGAALGGLLILALLILCQSAVFALGKRLCSNRRGKDR